MKIKVAEKYGFCFGVERAIDIAEKNPYSKTIGPLIHNPREIDRLKSNFSISTISDINDKDSIKDAESLIIRTHGIPKEDFKTLKNSGKKIIDATCPFVSKPQNICERMSKKNYQIIIYGDREHPEVKGVLSYGEDVLVVSCIEDLQNIKLKRKIAIISQTTKKIKEFLKVANYLVERSSEVRIFNTICNATFENQEAAYKLSSEVDIVLIIGGKNSSNTKQLFEICNINCKDSYLIEGINDIDKEWFRDKKLCGITAGASTPKWIIKEVTEKIEKF